MIRHSPFAIRYCLVILGSLALADLAAAQPLGPIEPKDGGLIDLPMLRDPVLTGPPTVTEYDPRFKAMWLAAIARPEYDLRLDAAKAFAEVREGGMENLEDVVPVLLERLENDDNIKVRLAAAEALVVFDAHDTAAALLAASQAPRNVGAGMVLTTDPALAAWNHRPAVAVWMQRLAQIDADPTRAASAMRSLATVNATEAIEPLRDAAADTNREVALRLEASRAVGTLATQGLVDNARILAEGQPLDRQIAVAMLSSHRDADAAELLHKLALDNNPAVAGAALDVLNHIDPAIVVGMASALIERDDANVRLRLAEALATDTSNESIVMLSTLLDDPSVAVRNFSRQTLAAFDAKVDRREVVRNELAAALRRDGWRGLEQAALLAGILDDKTTAEQLTNLLNNDRAETRLAAAAALRQLAVSEVLPAMLTRAEEITSQVPEAGPGLSASLGRETTQLFMAFGQMRYAPAEDLAKRYIPKHSGFDPTARGAAVYTLGKLYEDQQNSEYVSAFRARLSDINPLDPEAGIVRRFAAVGLGRMKAESAAGTLRQFAQDEATSADIGGSCRWAIGQITGQAPPEPEPLVSRPRDFFLIPIDD